MFGNTESVLQSTVEITNDYYDGLDKYGIDNRSDIVIPWIFSFSRSWL